ncbi:MAG: DUF1648 domain-containing protein [Prevotella sp.]|nr:DUF1648 domain-containing protein [Prevotella sp.]
MSDIKLNVVRTTKDKIFDVVFLVLTLTIWGIIIWLISRAPDIVPTHFGPSGKPDAYGSPTFILIPSAIMTVVALFVAFSIYLPFSSVNLPFYNGSGNARQKKLAVLLSRIIALFILGLMLGIAVYALAMKDHESVMPILIIVGLMIGVSLVFTIMMYRAK